MPLAAPEASDVRVVREMPVSWEAREMVRRRWASSTERFGISMGSSLGG